MVWMLSKPSMVSIGIAAAGLGAALSVWYWWTGRADRPLMPSAIRVSERASAVVPGITQPVDFAHPIELGTPSFTFEPRPADAKYTAVASRPDTTLDGWTSAAFTVRACSVRGRRIDTTEFLGRMTSPYGIKRIQND